MNLRKLFVITLLIFAVFVSCGSLQRYSDKNDFKVAVHGKEAEIAGYTGIYAEVRIPPRIGGLRVTKIGEAAFKGKKVSRVIIPRSVTYIGEEAFYDNALTSVVIPDRVAFIGGMAFYSNELAHVTIPKSVTKIEWEAFANNYLREIILPDGITSIEHGAFRANDLTSVTIPAGVVFIENYAFEENHLASITIPEGVVSIGDGAFRDNKLTEIIIPKSVTSIDRWAFENNSITRVTIGENVEIDPRAVEGFGSFYNESVRRGGGVYRYSNHHWSPEDKTTPVFTFRSHTAGEFPDIAFFADMPDLEFVYLRDNSLLTDITPLSGLTKLKQLVISNCPNIKSLEPLSSLPHLNDLYLTHNNSYGYGALASLRQLEDFSIAADEDQIDLKHIGRLGFLKRFTIGNNKHWRGDIKNIHELQNLVNLEELRIFSVNIPDISWASALRNLTALELDGCTIGDLSPLASLPNLAQVDLSFSPIKDIAPLANSNSIKYIKVFEFDVEAGISNDVSFQFYQKNITLDTFYDDR